MRTIITHFYNEEYLLPWWLNHHKKYFDQGILIDYHSTDRSVEIIKEICPNWHVVPSRFLQFDAHHLDWEIMWYERQVSGWRISIPVTEFLVGDVANLAIDTPDRTQFFIPSIIFSDFNPYTTLDKNKKLWEQCFRGVHYTHAKSRGWSCRSMHNFNDIFYEVGRHFHEPNTDRAMIFKYSHLLLGEAMISRKLQIQTKVSDFDRQVGFSNYHTWEKDDDGKATGGLSKYTLHDYLHKVVGNTYDCTEMMNSVLKYEQ